MIHALIRRLPDCFGFNAAHPGGGQWTTGGASAAVANAVAVATDAGRQAELGTGEEEKADSDPVGGLILPAAGAAAVVEAIGTETFAALTARAQNLVVSAMAAVTAMGNSATEKAQELYDVVQGAVSDWLEDNGPSADRVIGPMQRFGDNDLVYGPEADGELRFLAQQNGGVLLSNKPNDMTWPEFSLNTLNDAAKSGRQIHFDLTNVNDINGVLAGAGDHANTITGEELRYIMDNWDDFVVKPKFYIDGSEVFAPWTK